MSMGVAEAAEVLGVIPERVRGLIRSGTLTADRMGRAYALDPRDVDALAARSRRAHVCSFSSRIA